MAKFSLTAGNSFNIVFPLTNKNWIQLQYPKTLVKQVSANLILNVKWRLCFFLQPSHQQKSEQSS